MRNLPAFSIIIPTFNSGNDLTKCLESVVTQNYPVKEIIIIDKKSTDETIEIIQTYKRLYTYIISSSSEDLGIYDAMNIGVKKASGDWLYFLGSDDTLFNNDVLVNISNIITTNYRTKFIYGDVFTSAGYVQSYLAHNYQKLLYLNICHQAIFYHKSLFDNNSYNIKYSICSDWDLNLKVFKSENFPIYTETIIAKYNLTGVSSNWSTHPDYLANFSNKTELMLRYRSIFYLLYSYILRIQGRTKRLMSKNL